ncbi:MAG: EF-hand domain-containing protein, partial [bacterium]
MIDLPATAADTDEGKLSDADVEKLWKAFGAFDADASGAISLEELGEVMRSLGQTPTRTELRDLIKDVDTDLSGSIDCEEFKALMISRRGDRKSRLKLAFGVFDKDTSGRITADEKRSVMSRFGLADAELDDMVKEVDEDGDGWIGFEEFCRIMAGEAEAPRRGRAPGPSTTSGRAQPAAGGDATAGTAAAAAPEAVTPKPAREEAPSDIDPEVSRLRDLLAKHPEDEKMRGTSLLQMQIGLFRLIQGAAYRCFRESFSANHETHLRVRNLPYRISEFVPFVRTAVALYKSLDVVEDACHPVLDAVVQSLSDEYARLEDRMHNWGALEKTPEMLAEEKAMLEARSKSANAKEKFAAGIEFAITMAKKHLTVGDIVEGVLAVNELNRLRELELKQELAPPVARSEGDPKEYLKKWNRIILSDSLETVDGAMMPVAYWYEDFMPKLLAAFSVGAAADIQSNTVPDEAALDRWYEGAKTSGELSRYGAEMKEAFPGCTPTQKLRIKQAWRLTQHYLNGVQKRRERLEFGRESGALSQYVSFVDVYLDRSDVKDAQMRVSF